MTAAVEIFAGVGLAFFALAKGNARPGFNAIALGLFLAATPWFSARLPGHGDERDLLTVAFLFAAATVGTALGGGLKARSDEEDHDHGQEQWQDAPHPQ